MDKKHRNLTRWLKRGLSAVFLLAVVAMVVVAWMPKPVPVETAAVTRGELVVTVDEDGVRVRVRTDVLRSLDQVDAFIELGLRCRDGIRP